MYGLPLSFLVVDELLFLARTFTCPPPLLSEVQSDSCERDE